MFDNIYIFNIINIVTLNVKYSNTISIYNYIYIKKYRYLNILKSLLFLKFYD